jgi:hypothetical protein
LGERVNQSPQDIHFVLGKKIIETIVSLKDPDPLNDPTPEKGRIARAMICTSTV